MRNRSVQRAYFGACLAIASLAAAHVNAASQGGLGATSTGSVGLAVTIPASVYLQNAPPSLDMTTGTATHSACLAGKGIDVVSLAAEGSGPAGTFALTDDAGTATAFTAALNGKSFPSAAIALPPPGECRGLEITVQAAEADRRQRGDPRAGVLTLIVTPE